MGLTGLSVAWLLAGRYGAPEWVAPAIGAVAVGVFVALTISYALKMITAWSAVKAEFRHPIAGNLFGTFLISLLLLPIVLAEHHLALARGLWGAGVVGMLGFAWLIVSRWMSDHSRSRMRLRRGSSPWSACSTCRSRCPASAWPMPGLALFALSVGLFFAIPLFTLIFSRLVFEAPMPEALRPTLMILIAPFAVGMSTYTSVTGETDQFSTALYMLTLAVLAVLLGQMRYLARCCPFRVSWWAVSFPLAASAIAALRFAAARPGVFTDAVALSLLFLATMVIAGLSLRTIAGVARGQLRALRS